MSDAVEAGPGGVEKDAVELAEELRDPRNGSLRAVVRRIEALRTLIDGQGDSLRGRIARGEDRVDALEKEGAELARYVRRLDRSAHARLSTLETDGTKLAAAAVDHETAIRGLREWSKADKAENAEREKRLAALEEWMRGVVLRLDGLGQEAHDRANPGVLDLGGTAHLFPTFVRYTPDADMRTAGLTPERVYAVLGRDTRYVRLEGDDGKPVDIAPRFLVAVPGPADPKPDTSSPELAERRGAGPHLDTRVRGALVRCSRLGCAVVLPTNIERKDGTYAALCDQHCVGATIDSVILRAPDLPPADDFLTPPPLARAIGRAVMAAAARFPASNPTNARHFETIAKASAEVKAEPADVFKCRLATVRRMIEEGARTVDVVRFLDVAVEEAKRAGVIP